MGLSACFEWMLNVEQEIACVRTDPQGSWSEERAKSLPKFLDLWSKDWSLLENDKEDSSNLAVGLSACAEWILNFVQEIAGVRTDPEGSWSTKYMLFLSFLIYEAKTGPY